MQNVWQGNILCYGFYEWVHFFRHLAFCMISRANILTNVTTMDMTTQFFPHLIRNMNGDWFSARLCHPVVERNTFLGIQMERFINSLHGASIYTHPAIWRTFTFHSGFIIFQFFIYNNGADDDIRATAFCIGKIVSAKGCHTSLRSCPSCRQTDGGIYFIAIFRQIILHQL